MKNLGKKLLGVLIVVLVGVCLFACKKGKVIEPLYTAFDMKNVPDGIYHVKFDGNSFHLNNDEKILDCIIYSEDIYDTVDIHEMKAGDYFVQSGIKTKIENVLWDEQKSKCAINFPSWDEVMEEIRPSDAGGTYYISGPDDHHSYTERGNANIKISKKCVLKDASEWGEEEKKCKYDGLEDFIKNNNPDFFWCLNTSIRVEDEEIVEINRWYIP